MDEKKVKRLNIMLALGTFVYVLLTIIFMSLIWTTGYDSFAKLVRENSDNGYGNMLLALGVTAV